MAAEPVVSPEAEDDLAAAYDWYEQTAGRTGGRVPRSRRCLHRADRADAGDARENPQELSQSIGSAISVSGILRIRRRDRHHILHFPCFAGSEEVARAIAVVENCAPFPAVVCNCFCRTDFYTMGGPQPFPAARCGTNTVRCLCSASRTASQTSRYSAS